MHGARSSASVRVGTECQDYAATPHDELFKTTFSQLEHARAELRCVLPSELSRSFDWDTLTLMSGEFVDAQAAHLYSDLLFSVRVGPDTACVYVLFEHQSSVESSMPLRLLRYMTRIWERFEKDQPGSLLPPILPVVLHHSERGWTGPRRLRELFAVPALLPLAFDPFIPDFEFVLDDLSKLDDASLRARALTELARLTLLVMQRCRDSLDPVAILRPWSGALVAVLTASNGVSALSSLASYILKASEGSQEDLRDFFRELAPRAEEVAVTAAEKLKAQGREEGRERGRVELLLRQLTLRFGPLSPEVQARVETATPAAVDVWAERILSAASLDDVFR